MTPLRWGFLSTARINDLVLAGARRSRLAEVVAVASRDRQRAQAYARERGIERAYGAYEELLADGDVEAVYVSLPNALHVEWSLRALEAGKHVLCEKPLTRRPDEAEDAFAAAERRGLVLAEAFMWRHHPQTQRLVQLVEGGTIGDLRLIRAAFSWTADDPRDVRLLAELDGGSLLDVGCYCVNAARLLAGEPLRVFAQPVPSRAGVDLRLAATLVHPGGVLTVFDSAFDLPEREELEVVGSRGSIRLGDPWHGWTAPTLEVRREDGAETIALEPVDPYRLELEDFAAAARGARAPLLGRADAVGQARVLDALLRSAETGRPVELP
ncbi:MAG TPA: Gfo/Idh/MocA family oxidoreductase [Gaiellaceae bacterium]|nr:Gfo/Idh/MocA family oxidoreductase [Gaiellaceae bacterium]